MEQLLIIVSKLVLILFAKIDEHLKQQTFAAISLPTY